MDAISAFQDFIVRFQVLFLSIGVPLLTVGISWFVSIQTNRTSRQLAQKEREQNVELKLAEFRREWMEVLRDDLAKYSALDLRLSSSPSKDDLAKMVELGTRILTRLNPDDPDYKSIEKNLKLALAVAGKKGEERAAVEQQFGELESTIDVTRRILKREWEKIKSDLRRAVA